MPNNIATNNPQVREFITNNDAEGLARHFSSLPYGSTLTFISRNDDDAYLHQLQIIAQALENNQTITTFNLYHNNIGDAGAALLADALATNSTITNLNIGGNNIGLDGAASITGVLAENPTITNFDIADNNIGDQGMKALSQALQGNTTLRGIMLHGDNISEASLEAIVELLKNFYIEELYVRVDSIDQAIEPLLEENRSINAFIDSLKQNVSFDTAGINIGYLLPYFDFTPEAKAKINKKLSQEKAIDADGQEHSLANLIDEGKLPIESAVIKQMYHGAKPLSIKKVLTSVPDIGMEIMFSHLTSQDLKELFKALHFNNQANQHEVNNSGSAAEESPILHEGSPEVNTSGCSAQYCCVVS